MKKREGSIRRREEEKRHGVVVLELFIRHLL